MSNLPVPFVEYVLSHGADNFRCVVAEDVQYKMSEPDFLLLVGRDAKEKGVKPISKAKDDAAAIQIWQETDGDNNLLFKVFYPSPTVPSPSNDERLVLCDEDDLRSPPRKRLSVSPLSKQQQSNVGNLCKAMTKCSPFKLVETSNNYRRLCDNTDSDDLGIDFLKWNEDCGSPVMSKVPSKFLQVFNVPDTFEEDILLYEFNRSLWSTNIVKPPLKGALSCKANEDDGSVEVEFSTVEMASKVCNTTVQYDGRELVYFQKEVHNMAKQEETTLELTKSVTVFNLPDKFNKDTFLYEINRSLWASGIIKPPLRAALNCSSCTEDDGGVVVEFSTAEYATEACCLKIVYEGAEVILCLKFQRELLFKECEITPKPTKFVEVSNLPNTFQSNILLYEINRSLWDVHHLEPPLKGAVQCLLNEKNGSAVVEFLSAEIAKKALQMKIVYEGHNLILNEKDESNVHLIEEELPTHADQTKVSFNSLFDNPNESNFNIDSETTQDEEEEGGGEPAVASQVLIQKPGGKWPSEASALLVKSLVEYDKELPVSEWSSADWSAACEPVTETYGYNVEQCKARRKRIVDHHMKRAKEGIECGLYENVERLVSKPWNQKGSSSAEAPTKGKRWSENETHSLIDVWACHKDLRNKNIPNRDIWSKIANAHESNGFLRSSQQCQQRIQSVLDEFKMIVDKGKRSGSGADDAFPFYDALSLILHKSVTITPRYLVSAGSVHQRTSRDANPQQDERTGKARQPFVHRKTKMELQQDIAETKACAQKEVAAALRDFTSALRERK